MPILKDLKTGKEYRIDFTAVMFPSGGGGIRVENYESDTGTDFGTLVVVDGKLKIIQW